jgi:N-glycosylase/DNA lyase
MGTAKRVHIFSLKLQGPFHLERTLMCGQAFRWSPASDVRKEGGGGDNSYDAFVGVVAGSLVRLEHRADRLRVHTTSGAVDRAFMRRYLGLDDDLDSIYRRIRRKDPVMQVAVKAGRGMRLMRQEVWETLASFILSSASNIPRIRRCVEGVAKAYGKRLVMGKGDTLDSIRSKVVVEGGFTTAPGEPLSPYAFPTPRQVIEGGRKCLEGCRLGYREEYLWETAQHFRREGLAPEGLRGWEPEEARRFLLGLPGVGEKVADCVTLFALGRGATFPTDVWVRRAVGELYLGGEAMTAGKTREWGVERWGEDTGYAQQYLYGYVREKRTGKGGVGAMV